jgi:D-glycero-D-manno-heptose 1,7-bisphosphate phosphatase
MGKAVFLDRDGVLIEDVGLLTRFRDVTLLPGIPEALRMLGRMGYSAIVVTNQTVIARGMASEEEVGEMHRRIDSLLARHGAPPPSAYYICPHHPKADVERYRIDCDCRKPGPGLILSAARDHGVALNESFLVGDRISDIIAGKTAGCTSILVTTGRHSEGPIETSRRVDWSVPPDHICGGLLEAAWWIAGFT